MSNKMEIKDQTSADLQNDLDILVEGFEIFKPTNISFAVSSAIIKELYQNLIADRARLEGLEK